MLSVDPCDHMGARILGSQAADVKLKKLRKFGLLKIGLQGMPLKPQNAFEKLGPGYFCDISQTTRRPNQLYYMVVTTSTIGAHAVPK